MSYNRSFVDFAFDRSGNEAGIIGVWLVPDDFDRLTEYAAFNGDFLPKHKTKSGRLTERQRKTQQRAWVKWLSAHYVKVPHIQS